MVQVIVAVIFGGFGLIMLFVGVTQFTAQRRLLRVARPVEAEIIRSEVRTSTVGSSRPGRTSTTTHRPEVRFRYRAMGAEHESDMLYPTTIARSYASREAAAGALAPFPVGARVTAMVDELHPERAFLIPEASVGPVVFMVIGLVLPPAAWVIGGLL